MLVLGRYFVLPVLARVGAGIGSGSAFRFARVGAGILVLRALLPQ